MSETIFAAPLARLVLLPLLLLSGCGGGSEVELGQLARPGAARGYNVLLVTLDTVRKDRIGCYGYERAETPAIDSVAATGILFKDAVTSVPVTLPSHATILTGLYPPAHGVRDNGIYVLGEKTRTLPEILRDEGYETAAFIGCFVLDERFGLGQGFDLYDFHVSREGFRPEMPDFNERPAGAVTDAALRWLRERPREKPFFAWVHYFDPHLPYRSPLADLPRFAGRGYDAEIAYVDREFRRLLGGLDRAGYGEKTLLVLTSDHGESLGDHGEPTHSMLLYESTLAVPLLFHSPSLFGGKSGVDRRLAGLVDIRKTIEDLIGLGREGGGGGRSLLAPGADPERAVYIETEAPLHVAGWSPLSGFRTATGKYIHGPAPEFYDLRGDPGETRNLYDPESPEMIAFEKRLAESGRPGVSGPASRTMSDEEIERLASLGYAQGGGGGGRAVGPDPKSMMPVYRKSVEAEELYRQKKYEQAAAVAAEVIEQCPRCVQSIRVLAFSLYRTGRAEEAIGLLRRSTGEGRNSYLVRSLAQMMILNGDYNGAGEALDLYGRIDSLDGRVPLLRGDILARRGKLLAAIALYEEAIDLDENRVGIQAKERIHRIREGTSGSSTGTGGRKPTTG